MGCTTDVYPSNTALYAQPGLIEGDDYTRRHHRSSETMKTATTKTATTKTAVIAPHGGGIEAGTSELCLAVAGRDPASLEQARPLYDYWMFEGMRPVDNADLHVTSVHCDDPVALSLCGSSQRVIGLHGCLTSTARLRDDARTVLVGGRDETLRGCLLDELGAAGIEAVDASDHDVLSGISPENIANRTLRGTGGQLELTTPLRDAMFEINTIVGRPTTTTQVFWNFVRATRAALAHTEQQ